MIAVAVMCSSQRKLCLQSLLQTTKKFPPNTAVADQLLAFYVDVPLPTSSNGLVFELLI